MSRVIEAVYENGVFRPLEKIDIKEHEKVALKVVNHEEWRKRFDEIIGKIRETTSQFSTEEIEADIDEAVKEVRARKRGHQSNTLSAEMTTSSSHLKSQPFCPATALP